MEQESRLSPPQSQFDQGETLEELEFVPENPRELGLVERIQKLEQKDREKTDRIKELEKLAYFDNLTGLLNRNGLRRELEAKHLGRPDHAPLTGAMLVLDIDNFKTINDSYGHNVGDLILMAVAQHLKDQTRSTDLVARWGGEELVIVFDKTDEEGILNKFFKRKEGESQGRARINIDVRIEDEKKTITLSGGVTDFSMEDDFSKVFKQADEAVYQAKRSGKDRIIGTKSNGKKKA